MSIEKGIPLTFATFYACGIKQSTNLTQRNCINLLLRGYIGSDSSDILSDSVCTNYAKGKKNLSNELRVKLLNLDRESVIDRLEKINIQDFTVVSNALIALVINSALPENEKQRLLKCNESEDELAFIAEVFLNCIKGDNYISLSKLELNILESYRHNAGPASGKSNTPTKFDRTDRYDTTVSVSQSETKTDDTDEDFDWMRNYISDSIISTRPSFVRDKVKTVTVTLELPRDYNALIYSLKPTLTESAYEKFAIEDFINIMNIDVTRNTYSLKKGSLEYLQFEGTIESILPTLQNYNFSEVSDFAFQLIGEFTSKDVEKLKQYLKDISNDNVNILTSLIFDKELINVNLLLIAHKCNEKAVDQKSDRDHDGTHMYIPHRSTNPR